MISFFGIFRIAILPQLYVQWAIGFCYELSMKTKIGVYLTDDVARSFKLAMRRPGATKSGLVNEALRLSLSPPPEKRSSDEILQHLKRLTKRLRQMHRETEVMSETLALFVRYFLTITPPLPASERKAAQALGRERYQIFIEQIAKRVTSEAGMIADVAEAAAQVRRQGAVGAGDGPSPSERVEDFSHA
jgi:hypothetical protein